MSSSDLIGLWLLGAIWAFGLLPLSGFGLLSLLSFYRFWAFGLLSIVYVYFSFQTFGLCRTLYFRCYRYRAFWRYAIVLTFILWWRLLLLFELYYYFISAFIYLLYFESDECHILVSELFIYRNILLCKSGVTFLYQSYLFIVTFYYVNRGVTY